MPPIPEPPGLPPLDSVSSDGVTLGLRTAHRGTLSTPAEFSFTVTVQEVGTNDSVTQTREFPNYTNGETVLFLVNRGLREEKTYRFNCLASNNFGMSEFSTFSSPLKIPGEPTISLQSFIVSYLP